jgi:hypothetical protein
MPIIVDPRQNPRKEKRYGIIEVHGMPCYYDKEQKSLKKRRMPYGFEINDGITLSIPNNPPVIIYKGQLVTVKATIDEDAITGAVPLQGDIPKFIYDQLDQKMNQDPTWPPNSDVP